MFSALEVRNFRGYRHLSLNNLPRFNFVVGPSGSGKTALLEALWIVGGASPEIYFRMRAMRGIGMTTALRMERSAYETLFADIFTEIPPTDAPVASIDVFDSTAGARSLTISYGAQGALPLDLDPRRGGGNLSIRPIHFRWKLGPEEYDCPLIFENNQIIAKNPPPIHPAIFVSSSFPIDPSESVQRLSELRISRRSAGVVKAVSQIYPQVTGLAPEIVGGQQMIYAELADVAKNLPIPLVSSGVNKYVGIILAAHQYRGGAILVDEIENGFYYQDYKSVVAGIAQFCEDNDVQLFASTHSGEMLDAIAGAMEGHESDMAVLQTRRNEGASEVAVMRGGASRAALLEGMELR